MLYNVSASVAFLKSYPEKKYINISNCSYTHNKKRKESEMGILKRAGHRVERGEWGEIMREIGN